MILNVLKKEANTTYTENDAVTYRSTLSECLDLFATIGALRNAEEADIVSGFIKAYAEDADTAMKTLFFARDIRGGLGERRVFKTILTYLAVNEPESVRRNIEYIAEYGRYDDLLALIGTPCEADMMAYIMKQLDNDMHALEAGESVSLLAKWLPSVNASNAETVKNAKKIARALGMNDAQYRKTLTALRAQIKIIENNLREKDYSFDYEKLPSKALYKYRAAFLQNDADRYKAFLTKAEADPSVMHTGTLTPFDVVVSVIGRLRSANGISEAERHSMDVTWKSLEDYAGSENALAIVDGSASMYWGFTQYMPAAVAQSLGIYFAEHNKGAFKGHFITFSSDPKLVEVKGRDIVEKVKYCMSYNECANTDIAKTFDLILKTAVQNKVRPQDMPEKLYIISDMEFDSCAGNAQMSNFEYAKAEYARCGYKLPQIVFWNVASRNEQQPVTANEQGVALVSGCSPQIFSMLSKDLLDPYAFMMDVLYSARYEKIAA
ncbi:protein of unknown function [Lachnospiraceae bacterium XBB2008]|nr:protein of unknown function [Lachnospiraceae bacterium XBB2008]